ncbi:MAG: peptidase C45 [Planctomycetaceae bacterium]|nr:peptidase C45 [Planctomycetaceae bacterium]
MPASPQFSPSRYREIDVSGTPRELGRQIGEAAGEEVRGFCSVALERVNLSCRISRERAIEVARRSQAYAEQYSPDLVEELAGTAEAARVSLDDLMLLQVRNQLRSEEQGACTSIAVAGTGPREQTGTLLLGQNWDADPALDPFTIVLTRRPADKPAFQCVTQAGLIAYIGYSEAGMGVCLNTLPAPSRVEGVPHYFTVRRILESRSLQEAVAAVTHAERAIPANIMLASPEGPADLEITLESVEVLYPQPGGLLTHTNHCEHQKLRQINEQFPELIQSHSRKARADSLLAGATALDRQAMELALADHQDQPRSICRHTSEDADTGFWQTVFSIIMEPAAGCMHVTRGTPCDHPRETYRLN